MIDGGVSAKNLSLRGDGEFEYAHTTTLSLKFCGHIRVSIDRQLCQRVIWICLINYVPNKEIFAVHMES